MQRALAAAVLVGLLCGILGFFVVLRRLAFIGVGISHSAIGGVAIGILAGWSPLSGRALARAPLGGGFPALPFRLQGGVTVPPWATFPAAPPKIPYDGFSPVRLQASGTSQFGTEPSAGSSRSRPIPPYPQSDTAFTPPFDDASRRLMLHLCVRNCRLQHRHLSPEALAPAGLCCPGHRRLSASSASLDVSASFPGRTGYRRGL